MKAMFVELILPVVRERLVKIRADAFLKDAARLLHETQKSLVVACSPDGAMVGVVTKSDVVRQISRCLGGACTTAVAAVMTQDVTYCHPEDSLQDVWATMKERGFLHFPVVDRELRPLGVLNARDALHALLGEVENEESLLRDYVMGIGYR
jgi:CBS domain-containing protein